MMIAKNDEVKRSRIWRFVTLGSSALIIIVAVYMLTKMFTTNPLEGRWTDEDGNYTLSVKSNSSVTVTIPDIAENQNIIVKMDYALNKEGKTFAVKQNHGEIVKSAKKYDVSATAIENALSPITTMFDYSVDQKTLTLTEREYGEQLVFIKQ